MARLGEAASATEAPSLPKPQASGPVDFVSLAAVTSASGLKGQVRARVLSPSPAAESVLMDAQLAWVHLPRLGWWHWTIEAIRPQAQDLRIHFQAIQSRDLAEQLLGAEIGLSKSELPGTEVDETYWLDLIGCEVTNQSGQRLGPVERLETNGVQDWLVVGPHWIPYVDRHVLSVDLDQRQIAVDWELDWT